jgi:hypothetical protein
VPQLNQQLAKSTQAAVDVADEEFAGHEGGLNGLRPFEMV